MPKVSKTLNAVAYENTYYIYNDENLILVDPGSDTEQILRAIEEINRTPVAILLTHTHYDHIMSVEAVRAKYSGIPLYVSHEEESWLYTPELNLSGLARHDDMENVVVQPAEFEFEIGKIYELGGMEFKVLATPGHSIGGVSFVFDEFVISGDALFKGGIGRWDLPTGNKEQLLESIRTQLFTLDKNLTVLAGHGDVTTIGAEKLYNPYF
ncbi:Glyoxylase, beta-lactamase superfamily II [Pilibacter termitis]|uniref:Glyoxylase, beta-lactamase superfamily II n=1 Tax=Pilibacter termitis TaxID=263852 RepID=A0A1T4Q8E8_9ENTE|nr:MBL fold metallo-hydrolase [Pilibacter termitis]SJZ99917.1 Glyoxylase, beta-lactamase superfamily II [Pilibacter termitis]